jgi:hypothetical protein
MVIGGLVLTFAIACPRSRAPAAVVPLGAPGGPGGVGGFAAGGLVATVLDAGGLDTGGGRIVGFTPGGVGLACAVRVGGGAGAPAP